MATSSHRNKQPAIDDANIAIAGNKRSNPPQGDPESPKKKKNFSSCWNLSDFVQDNDSYNQRNDDETLKPLATHTDFTDNLDSDTLSFFEKVMEEMDQIYSSPYPVASALGNLTWEYYFLLPANYNEVCSVDCFGKGIDKYDPGNHVVAGVYALAKQQYLSLNNNDEESSIKWAVLRTEAFKAGWCANQKFCTRKILPLDYMLTFSNDSDKINNYMDHAFKLSCFVPFLNEFCFRSYGSTYNSYNADEFIMRAEKFARISQNSEILNYMSAHVLYGLAFTWIGVQRPMEVLKMHLDNPLIAKVFKDRYKAPPAGQAVITSSFAIIQELTSANLWNEIKLQGKYVDDMLISVTKKISEEPWKYHMFSSAYGYPPLNDKELAEIKEARDLAILFTPILQGFVDVILFDKDLGRVKTLKKHARSNSFLYNNAISYFRYSKKKMLRNAKEKRLPRNVEKRISLLKEFFLTHESTNHGRKRNNLKTRNYGWLFC